MGVALVRGYHVYKDVWAATDGEILQCRRETSGRFHPFAVVVIKDGAVVGHAPQNFLYPYLIRTGNPSEALMNMII